MPFKILTPNMIWDGFDAVSLPLNQQLVFEENNKAFSKRIYTITSLKDDMGESVITEIKTFFPTSDCLGAIVVIKDYFDAFDENIAVDLAKYGYAVFIPDLTGREKTLTKYTKAFYYGVLSDENTHFKKVSPTAKETVQYLYSAIVRRVITFVNEVSNIEKIAVVGNGDAVEIAMQVAGTEKRLNAVVALNGSGYREYINVNKYEQTSELVIEPEQMSWLTGVASVAYAGHIDKPVFIAFGSNSAKVDPDRLENFIGLLPTSNVYSVICPRIADAIDKKAYNSFIAWLRDVFNNNQIVSMPTVKIFVNSEHKMYADVEVCNLKDISEVNVFFSFNQFNHKLRNYFKTGGIRTGDKSYIAEISCPFDNAPLFTFAEVSYVDGTVITSDIEYLNLDGTSYRPSAVKNVRKLHQTSDGKGYFAVQPFESISKNAELLEVEIPCGSNGLQAKNGILQSYVLGSRQWESKDKLLQIDIFGEEFTAFEIILKSLVNKTIIDYKYSFECPKCEKMFYPLRLKSTDFKNKDRMPLNEYSNLVAILIKGDVIVGNIIYI